MTEKDLCHLSIDCYEDNIKRITERIKFLDNIDLFGMEQITIEYDYDKEPVELLKKYGRDNLDYLEERILSDALYEMRDKLIRRYMEDIEFNKIMIEYEKRKLNKFQ